MKKIKLKKLTLSEMPTDTLDQINSGRMEEVKDDFATITISLISIYTVSIIMSGCDDCASYTCPTKASQSRASCCLCSGYYTC